MDTLPVDLLNYFAAIDLYHLKLTSKYFRQIITQDIINYSIVSNINNKLENEYQGILDFLKNNKAFISGSFIIQNILNEYYVNSDIDIYFPFTDKNDLEITRPIDNFNVIHDTLCYDGAINATAIKMHRVTDYRSKSGKCLQVIYIQIDDNRQSIIDYLSDGFDFDICKNFYRYNELYIDRIDQICNKQLHFKINNNYWERDKTMNRVYKYQNRGFNVINYHNISELSQQAVVVYRVKHIKYRLYQLISGEIDSLTDIKDYLIPHDNECRCRRAESINKCIELRRYAIEEQQFFNQSTSKDIIFLSNEDRDTEIDLYIKLYYPIEETHILWSNKSYYLFVTSQ